MARSKHARRRGARSHRIRRVHRQLDTRMDANLMVIQLGSWDLWRVPEVADLIVLLERRALSTPCFLLDLRGCTGICRQLIDELCTLQWRLGCRSGKLAVLAADERFARLCGPETVQWLRVTTLFPVAKATLAS
jgi:hypothetical protein